MFYRTISACNIDRTQGVYTSAHRSAATPRPLYIGAQVGSNPKTFYVFAGSTLLGEVQNGVPSVAYAWGANGLVSERLLATNRSLWYAFGPQGETRQLTDSTGAVADTYLYSPYGTLLSSSGSDANPFQYGGQTGYYADANNLTGTLLCGLRWYAPALGRWLSRDPIGYEGGANLYEYCGSNPIGNLDPFGMDDGDSYISRMWQFTTGVFKQDINAAVADPMIALMPGGSNVLVASLRGWRPFHLNSNDEQDGASFEEGVALVASFFIPGGEGEGATSFGRLLEQRGTNFK